MNQYISFVLKWDTRHPVGSHALYFCLDIFSKGLDQFIHVSKVFHLCGIIVCLLENGLAFEVSVTMLGGCQIVLIDSLDPYWFSNFCFNCVAL